MAATTTPHINDLAKTVLSRFTGYSFVPDDHFSWSSDKNTVYYQSLKDETAIWTLLHEVAHAELNHTHYMLDIELIDHEVAAWEHARTVLGPQFGLTIDDDHIQDHLDTYRHWLHQRSVCPNCAHNGIQTTQNTYNCSNCRCLWRVNDARGCALRRTKL